MRAVRFENKAVVLSEAPMPPGDESPEHVRVRVRSCGICGSDLTILDSGFSIAGIPGHEIAGELEDGTPVAIEPIQPCGACVPCADGDYQVCATGNENVFGISRDGGMAEYVSVPKRCLVQLPTDLDPTTACLVEPLAVGVHGVRRAGVTGQSKVLVLGGGSIGLCAAAAAVSAGIDVDLVARHAPQVEAARLVGAQVLESGAGGDYDVVLDCAGTESAGIAACDAIRPRGVMILLAPSWDRVILPGMTLAAKELEFRVSMMYGRSGSIRDVDVAARILADTPAVAQALISHRFPLEQAAEAFEMARQRSEGAIKVVIEP